jgi:hypothetical protein
MKNILRVIIYNFSFSVFAASGVFSQAGISDRRAKNIHNDTSQDTADFSKSSAKNKSVSAVAGGSIKPIISFEEFSINHNEHIASDGNYYYTINGGNSSIGQINKFSFNGTLIKTYPINIDGRGLSYNRADSFLYASLYQGDIVKITNLEKGAFKVKFKKIMQNDQASFAISPDGSKFLDFYRGTLKVHDFNTGAVIKTITGLSYGDGNFGGEAAIAVGANHVYTWNADMRTVYAYDRCFVEQSVVLAHGDLGMSISFANGLLFVSKDGNYDTGEWYGYRIKDYLDDSCFSSFNDDAQLSEETSAVTAKNFRELQVSNAPNPFSNTTKIIYNLPFDGKVSLKVFDPSGREVATLVNTQQRAGAYKIDFNASKTLNGFLYYRVTLIADGHAYEKVGKMAIIK